MQFQLKSILYLFLNFIILFYVYRYFDCMYVYVLCMCLVLKEVKKKASDSLEFGDIDVCEPLCGC